jgi:hypothetical protein
MQKYGRESKEPYIDVKEVFRNKKIHDLMDRSAMEIEDYRRNPKEKMNLFFGLKKTILGWEFQTLYLNMVIVVLFIGFIMFGTWANLKIQLTRTSR